MVSVPNESTPMATFKKYQNKVQRWKIILVFFENGANFLDNQFF